MRLAAHDGTAPVVTTKSNEGDVVCAPVPVAAHAVAGAGLARAAGRQRAFTRRDLCPLHERRTQVPGPHCALHKRVASRESR